MARRVIIRSLRDPDGGGSSQPGIVTEREVEIGGTEPAAPAELWVDTSQVSPPPTGTVTLAMNDLTDADTATVAPVAGDGLTWDGTNWVPGAGGGGVQTPQPIDWLTDVDTTTIPPQDGAHLEFWNAKWIPQPAPIDHETLESLDDVQLSATLVEGEVLTYDNTLAMWVNRAPTGPTGPADPQPIDWLTDVDTTSVTPVAGQALIYGPTGLWAPGDVAGGPTGPDPTYALDDLTDVDTTTVAPVFGNSLVWDGTQWEPGVAQGSGIPIFPSAVERDAAITAPIEGNLAYLQDTGYYTWYTGTAWANATQYGASVSLGSGAVAGPNENVAIGVGANAGPSQWRTVAIGPAAVASGVNSYALGWSAQATGSYSTVLGTQSSATGARTLALGGAAHATHDDAVAIGYEAVTTANSQIVLGRAGDGTTTFPPEVVVPGTLNVSGVPVVTTGATDGQVLTFTTATGWAAADGGGGGTQTPQAIDWLTDVDTTSVVPLSGQTLVWDGANWVPGPMASGTGDYLTFADATERNAALPGTQPEGKLAYLRDTNYVTQYDAGWKPVMTWAGGGAFGTNVYIDSDYSLAVGRDARASGGGAASEFIGTTAVGRGAEAGSVGISGGTAIGGDALASLARTTAIGASAEATALRSTALGSEAKGSGNYSSALGARAVASAAGSVAIGTTSTGIGATSAVQNQITLGTNLHTTTIPGLLNVSGVNVVTTGATEGQVLTFTGGKWTAGAGGGGTQTPQAIDWLTDVDTTGVVEGQVLAYSGGVWAPGTTGLPPSPLGQATGDLVLTLVGGAEPATWVASSGGVTPPSTHSTTRRWSDSLVETAVLGEMGASAFDIATATELWLSAHDSDSNLDDAWFSTVEAGGVLTLSDGATEVFRGDVTGAATFALGGGWTIPVEPSSATFDPVPLTVMGVTYTPPVVALRAEVASLRDELATLRALVQRCCPEA